MGPDLERNILPALKNRSGSLVVAAAVICLLMGLGLCGIGLLQGGSGPPVPTAEGQPAHLRANAVSAKEQRIFASGSPRPQPAMDSLPDLDVSRAKVLLRPADVSILGHCRVAISDRTSSGIVPPIELEGTWLYEQYLRSLEPQQIGTEYKNPLELEHAILKGLIAYTEETLLREILARAGLEAKGPTPTVAVVDLGDGNDACEVDFEGKDAIGLAASRYRHIAAKGTFTQPEIEKAVAASRESFRIAAAVAVARDWVKRGLIPESLAKDFIAEPSSQRLKGFLWRIADVSIGIPEFHAAQHTGYLLTLHGKGVRVQVHGSL